MGVFARGECVCAMVLCVCVYQGVVMRCGDDGVCVVVM